VLTLNEAPTSTTCNLGVHDQHTGSNVDPDGYTVTVDGAANQAIGPSGTVTFSGLTAGAHSVAPVWCGGELHGERWPTRRR